MNRGTGFTDFGAFLGRASPLAIFSVAGPACAADGASRTAEANASATVVADGNVVVVSDRITAHPDSEGSNRIVTIICSRRGVEAARGRSSDATERLEHALARINHEDKLDAEVKGQVEGALREGVGQLSERR